MTSGGWLVLLLLVIIVIGIVLAIIFFPKPSVTFTGTSSSSFPTSSANFSGVTSSGIRFTGTYPHQTGAGCVSDGNPCPMVNGNPNPGTCCSGMCIAPLSNEAWICGSNGSRGSNV